MADSEAVASAAPIVAGPPEPEGGHRRNFRFYDNRQKYLMFVNTCSEKWEVAARVAAELDRLQARPPAIRLFDAGVGDGTVLTRVMRALHRRHPQAPFYIAGKEISLEDVRLALEKMPDRFYEHPNTCLVMTNMAYAEAPWLTPRAGAERVAWRELALKGATAAEFEDQIIALEDFLGESWRAGVSEATGNPVYETPAVLVIYREDCSFVMDQVLPRQGEAKADFDLVIASQAYRARSPTSFKAKRVIAPLVRALSPGGRLLGIQSHGDDPGLELVREIWPGEDPFASDRHALLAATREALGPAAAEFDFDDAPDSEALFRYQMHTLPGEIGQEAASIGTSTLWAAWNAATYVAQIEDERLSEAMTTGAYLDATRKVLKKYGELWFTDEWFVISRERRAAGSGGASPGL